MDDLDAFGATPGELVTNTLSQEAPKLCPWEGRAQGTPLSFYTDSANKFRGGSSCASAH